MNNQKKGFTLLGYSSKQIGIVLGSLVIVLVSIYLAFYGYNLDQIEEQVFNVPWGLDVVGYTFFALMATGSAMVNSVYTVFGYKGQNGEYSRFIKYGAWFSLVTILPAWLLVLLSLAKPFDFTYIFVSPRISSRITWMAILYTFYALMEAIELLYMILSERFERIKQIKYMEMGIGILVLIAVVSVCTNLGQVFGSLISMPAWYGPWFSVYFIFSAVLLGASAELLFMYPILRKEGSVRSFISKYYSAFFVIGIAFYTMYLTWIILSAWYSRETIWPVYQSLLYGAGAPIFWGVEIFIGLIIPLLISIYTLKKGNIKLMLLSAALLVIGGFASKYSIIVLPQQLRPYVWLTLQISNFSYFPSTGLIIMFIAAVLFWAAAFAVGSIVLPLNEKEKAKHLWIFR